MEEKEIHLNVDEGGMRELSESKTPSKSRKVRKEEKIFQNVLLSLINQFFQYREKYSFHLDLVEYELDRLNRQWKVFVYNWNNNHRRTLRLRPEDFLTFILKKLNELENEKD